MRIVLLMMALAGASAAAYAVSMPACKDPAAMERLDEEYIGGDDGPDRRASRAEYFRRRHELLTPRNDIMDLGLGITSLAVSLYVASIVLKVKHVSDWWTIQSPAQSRTIYLLLNCAWLGGIPSRFIYYLARSQRGDYPAFADSIGIPICGGAGLALILWPVLNRIARTYLADSRHPVRLFTRLRLSESGRSLSELSAVAVLGMCLILVILNIRDGDVTAVPLWLVLLYVALSLRAGCVATTMPAPNVDEL